MYNNYQQQQDGNPYQPRDAVVSRIPVIAGGYEVGAVLFFSSGRTCLTISTFGLWAEVMPTSDPATHVVIKRKTGKGSKPFEESVGFVKNLLSGGQLVLPAIPCQYTIGKAQNNAQGGYAPQPQQPQQQAQARPMLPVPQQGPPQAPQALTPNQQGQGGQFPQHDPDSIPF